MEPRHQVSRTAITLIKRFEGLRREAAQLDDGRWTIGHGHTRTARPGRTVDEADAEALLLYDLIEVSHAVNEWAYAPLNQNQFNALVSFAFNIGLENFRRSLTLRRLNEGRMVEAALAMELWRRADFEGERIVIDALVRRRAYEKALFLKPMDAWGPAATPVLPPKLDYDSASTMPSRPPTVVTSKMDGELATAELQAPPSSGPADPVDETHSATLSAAAALAARLSEIVPDEAMPPLQVELSAGLVRDLGMAPETGEPTVTIQPVSTDPADDVAMDAPSAPAPRTNRTDGGPSPDRPLPLLLLGLAGVVLFVIAVGFGFRSPMAGAPPFAGGLLGWVFGGAGIVCFALASYFLLVGLGEKSRPPGA